MQARNAPDGPPTVSALAEQLHTDRTTMTRNLRTLQQAGFIDLVPGADARSRCVVVTPEGRARIREAAALWRQAQQRVRELCGSEQIGALESLVLGMLPVLETARRARNERRPVLRSPWRCGQRVRASVGQWPHRLHPDAPGRAQHGGAEHVGAGRRGRDYVGQLGTVSLAAMALVFPLAMLTQMMSNGAMGSGVSSAISRALGAGDGARASALALHSIVIGTIAGLLYSLIFVLCGATFYSWLGGRGEVLAAATGFGAVLFSGAILVWLCNTLASVVRGTGNMRMPSAVIFAASLVQIAVGGTLGLGLGPMPRWGMPGVAVGNIVAMALAVAVFLAYLQWGQQRLQLDWRRPRLAWPMFRDILRVGALACLSPCKRRWPRCC